MTNVEIKIFGGWEAPYFPFSAPRTPSIYLDIYHPEISAIVKGKEQKEGSIGPYLRVT